MVAGVLNAEDVELNVKRRRTTGWSVFPRVNYARDYDEIRDLRNGFGFIYVTGRTRHLRLAKFERRSRKIRMADAMCAVSKRLLDRCESCVTMYMCLLNHLMASGHSPGAWAESCSHRGTHHSHDECEQQNSHGWKPLVHSHRL